MNKTLLFLLLFVLFSSSISLKAQEGVEFVPITEVQRMMASVVESDSATALTAEDSIKIEKAFAGVCYHLQNRLSPPDEEIELWYELMGQYYGTNSKSLQAQFANSAYLYYNGKNQKPNAAFWLKRKATLENCAQDFRESGLMYLRLGKDFSSEADSCFRDGAKLGDDFCRAWVYEQKEDYKSAIEFYQLAAKDNTNMEAKYRAAKLMQKVKSSDVSTIKAYFLDAAQLGHAFAAYEIALYYYEDETPKGDQLAFKYFEQAAKSNIPEALYCLGVCYKDGIGTTKNRDEALKYLKRAKELGEPRAGRLIEEISVGNLYRSTQGTQNPLKIDKELTR